MSNILKTIRAIILNKLQEHRISVNQIILFGSRSRSDFNNMSDYDLLIIIENDIDRKEKMKFGSMLRKDIAKRTYNNRIVIGTDIIIKSIKEINEAKKHSWSVTYEALKKGITL